MGIADKTADPDIVRRRIRVSGIVQGVGFRPFVYTLALDLALVGFVGNDSGGVFIEVEGSPEILELFLSDLEKKAPPLAHIEEVTARPLPVRGDKDFAIVQSENQEQANTLLSPDVTVCDACLAETLDSTNRRYRYPFTNCTNCGPRFTIIQDIPYDRPLTTMSTFTMCDNCQAEYDDPLNRRFHAQPNACPVCGPHVWLEETGDQLDSQGLSGDPIQITQQLLAAGKIVAIKGLGGFHLACAAASKDALSLLRERKGRVEKPFAVMAADIDTVQLFAELSDEEATILSSKERPIVLLKKKQCDLLSDLIAPGNQMIGVMLPYTPLHTLLLTDHPFKIPVLVMTSGNFSDEPIVKDNDEALARLSSLANAFLLHNREIEARCDDSVIRLLRGSELPVRRSRGYAPFPVRLPHVVPPLLAAGGELKATFCLAQDQYAYMSQHIGDMENLETLEAFEAAVAHYQHVFRIEPQLIACDMHPGYLSTRWALEQEARVPVIQIQHHHAHLAAVLAEHQIPSGERAIGFSFDGTGYGPDGAIWGGEVMIAGYGQYERVSHLRYSPLPGGDAAIKRPYRLALAQLWSADLEWDERLAPVTACPESERAILRQQLESQINTVPTSSMGRLFDAVASLAGVRQVITYEAQAAIELESLAASGEAGSYRFDTNESEFDASPVLQSVVEDSIAGVAPQVISARFHNALADLILEISLDLRQGTGLNRVALSGGVFQNVTLLNLAMSTLAAAGFETLVHHLVPANDGGLALGQAIIAANHS